MVLQHVGAHFQMEEIRKRLMSEYQIVKVFRAGCVLLIRVEYISGMWMTYLIATYLLEFEIQIMVPTQVE